MNEEETEVVYNEKFHLSKQRGAKCDEKRHAWFKSNVYDIAAFCIKIVLNETKITLSFYMSLCRRAYESKERIEGQEWKAWDVSALAARRMCITWVVCNKNIITNDERGDVIIALDV